MFNWKAENEEKKEFVTVGEGESAHAIPVDYMKKDKSSEDLRKEFRKYQDEIFEKHKKGTLTKEEHEEYLKKSEEFSDLYKKATTKENNKAYKEIVKMKETKSGFELDKLTKDKIATIKIEQEIAKKKQEQEEKRKQEYLKRVEEAKKEETKRIQERETKEKENKEKAQTETLEQYLDRMGVKARRGPVYELHKYDWEQAQLKAENQILLDENVGGKGRHFSTRFLEPGLVKYSFGVCLLEKETIDRFIYNFVGCPVIINHKDVTNESAKDDRVGVISRVWFNETDGWYWGEGVIFEQEALDLIDKGYNVSCQYEISEYSSTGGIHNGNEYDKVILNGKPEHLAIVQNPRYENAMIAVNATEGEGNFVTLTRKDGSPYKAYLPEGKTVDSFSNYLAFLTAEKLNKNSFIKPEEIDNILNDIKAEVEYESSLNDKNKVELEPKMKGIKAFLKAIANEDITVDTYDSEGYDLSIKGVKSGGFNRDKAERIIDSINKNKKIPMIAKLSHIDKDLYAIRVKVVKNSIAKNDIIQAINDIKEIDMFKNLFKKKEKNMDKDEIKSIFMECLTELTASNEAEKKEEVKEEVKEEEKEVAENKCKNEEPDYKKMYEDLKAKCEAKEEKEKAKNAIDEQKELLNSGKVETKIDYITEKRAKELGKELF